MYPARTASRRSIARCSSAIRTTGASRSSAGSKSGLWRMVSENTRHSPCSFLLSLRLASQSLGAAVLGVLEPGHVGCVVGESLDPNLLDRRVRNHFERRV